MIKAILVKPNYLLRFFTKISDMSEIIQTKMHLRYSNIIKKESSLTRNTIWLSESKQMHFNLSKFLKNTEGVCPRIPTHSVLTAVLVSQQTYSKQRPYSSNESVLYKLSPPLWYSRHLISYITWFYGAHSTPSVIEQTDGESIPTQSMHCINMDLINVCCKRGKLMSPLLAFGQPRTIKL